MKDLRRGKKHTAVSSRGVHRMIYVTSMKEGLFCRDGVFDDLLCVVAGFGHDLGIIGILPCIEESTLLLKSIFPDSGISGVWT